MRVQLGEGEVEVGDLVEEGPCVALEEVQVGVGSLGLHAKLHYVLLVVAHHVETQRLSGLMGWEGLEQEVKGRSWFTLKERELCCSGKNILYLILSLIMQTTNKHTCNLQVDVLNR